MIHTIFQAWAYEANQKSHIPIQEYWEVTVKPITTPSGKAIGYRSIIINPFDKHFRTMYGIELNTEIEKDNWFDAINEAYIYTVNKESECIEKGIQIYELE